MKKILFVCIMVASVTIVNAQNFVGVQVGYAQSISRLNSSNDGKVLNPTAYNGFKVGFVYDATIVKGFGVAMGLNYTFGANATDWKSQNITSLYPKLRTRGQYHQVEIPVDWQYKFEIAKRTWLVLYTGPTIQCGLAFKTQNYVKDGKQEQLNPQNPADNLYSDSEMSDYALKRVNVTWGIGAGFQYERYFLRGGYDFGLINPYKVQSFIGKDVYTRGRLDQWQLKLGIYLWEK